MCVYEVFTGSTHNLEIHSPFTSGFFFFLKKKEKGTSPISFSGSFEFQSLVRGAQ